MAQKTDGTLARFLPITAALRGIREPGRRRDLAAGVGVAAILVPQGMAYGQLAGLQPVVGLYSALGAMVLFALVSRTRQLIVGQEASRDSSASGSSPSSCLARSCSATSWASR